MMDWLRKNGEALQGIGSILTAILAVVALFGVKMQIDAQEQAAQRQAGREIYREFLALSLANPKLADPGICPAFDDATQVQYEFYLEHLLYTAEEVIRADPSWSDGIQGMFLSHAGAICAETDWSGYTRDVQLMMFDVQRKICDPQPNCPSG